MHKKISSVDDSRIRYSRMTSLNYHRGWWHLNQLSMMFCQSPAKKLSIVLDYSMHDQTLNRAKYTNYLGISLTSDLNRNKHIHQITGNAKHDMGLRETPSQQLKTNTYKTSPVAHRQCWFRLTMLCKQTTKDQHLRNWAFLFLFPPKQMQHLIYQVQFLSRFRFRFVHFRLTQRTYKQ